MAVVRRITSAERSEIDALAIAIRARVNTADSEDEWLAVARAAALIALIVRRRDPKAAV